MSILVRVLAYLTVMFNVLPAVQIGSFNFRLDLILVLVLLGLIAVKKRSLVGSLRELKLLLLVAVGLFLAMTISDNLGQYYFRSDYFFYFPRESIQIFARIAALIGFVHIGFYQTIKTESFIKLVSAVFLGSLAFGVLQKLGIPSVTDFSIRVFALSEQQIRSISSGNARVFGTAGNVLTWGGLSMLMSFYFYFIERRKAIRIAGVGLALINVFISASRASVLGTLGGFVFIQIFRALFIDKRLTKAVARLVGMLALAVVLVGVFMTYFPKQLEFLMLRFISTQDDITHAGRGAQLQYFLKYFDGQEALYFLGLGKPIMDDGTSLMEIEFTYVLFAYGVIGFFLHYYIVILLVKVARKLASYNLRYYLFIITSLVGFLIFSVGYYFFREIIGGLPFWWISGYLIGCMLREKSHRDFAMAMNTQSTNAPSAYARVSN